MLRPKRKWIKFELKVAVCVAEYEHKTVRLVVRAENEYALRWYLEDGNLLSMIADHPLVSGISCDHGEFLDFEVEGIRRLAKNDLAESDLSVGFG